MPSSPENYSLTAVTIPFSVTAVKPGKVGNAGASTLEIDGAKFDRDTSFRLIGLAGNVIKGNAVEVQDAATAYVTFDLTGAPVGNYNVQATAADGTTTILAGGLTLTLGTGGNLQVNLSGPSSTLPNKTGVLEINYANDGDADVPAPLLFVISPSNTPLALITSDMSMAQANVVFLATSQTGPAGVLPPGTSSSEQIYFQAPAAGAPNTFQYVAVTTDNTTPVDWNEVQSWVSSIEMEAPNWPAVWANLQQRIGPTWGDFVKAMDSEATLFPTVNGNSSDPYYLLDLEVQKAIASVAGTSLSGTLHVSDPAVPAVAIAGQTIFAQNTTTGDVFSAATLNDGSFLFNTLPPGGISAGTYTFSVDGLLLTSNPTVTINAGQAVTGVVLTAVIGEQISGSIIAEGSNLPIASAIIRAVNELNGSVFTAASSQNGSYSITGLAPGLYALTVDAPGFAQTVVTGLDVTTGNAVEDVTMAAESIISGLVIPQAGGGPFPIHGHAAVA